MLCANFSDFIGGKVQCSEDLCIEKNIDLRETSK